MGRDMMERGEFIEYLDDLIEMLDLLRDQLEDGSVCDATAVLYFDEKPLLKYLYGEINFD